MNTISADAFKAKYGGAALASFGQPTQSAEKGYVNNLTDAVGSDIANRVQKVTDIENAPDRSIAEKGVQIFGQGAGLAANALEKTVTEIPGVKQVAGAVGEGINWLATSHWSPIKHLADVIGSDKTLQAVTHLYDTNPRFKDTVDAAANTVRLGGDVSGIVNSANFAANVTNNVIKTVKEKTIPAISDNIDSVHQKALDLKKSVQTTIAGKNVDPQLEASASRLFLDGTKSLKDPIATYDTYLTQSKKALTDIKVDPAISIVGNEMGDAFNKVVAQRRAVGAVMGTELKKIGGIKADIGDAFTNLETQLKDSGVRFNGNTKKVVLDSTSKMTSEDAALLTDYIKQFNKLGSTPTVAEIDGFIARTQGLVNNFKSAKGIVQTTNAERLIKGSQAALRAQLDPKKTGLSQLSKYAKARATYSDLSSFIEDGANYLGKLTQSGDFSKDASIAKSAVQSILNNGKKDWMIRLEALTGYPALDKAVLALQAMKDAGDFRGLSLLQAMSEGSVPTSKAGFTKKILDYALAHGAKLVAGTPEEQTKAFLADLLKSPRKTSP